MAIQGRRIQSKQISNKGAQWPGKSRARTEFVSNEPVKRLDKKQARAAKLVEELTSKEEPKDDSV